MPGSEASWIQHGLDREAAQALNFPLPSYVSLGKLFDLSVPQFPHR